MSIPDVGWRPGYVYLSINYAMPGLLKAGRTAGTPEARAAELSGATGVPVPFTLVFDIFVTDCVAVEAAIHRALTDRGFRSSENREFFSAPAGRDPKPRRPLGPTGLRRFGRPPGRTVGVPEGPGVRDYE